MELETDDIELDEDDVIEFNGEKIKVSSLARLDDVSRNRMLAEIGTPEEAAEFLKMARAAKAAAERLEFDKKERDKYAELVLWGLRKLGETIERMDKAKGIDRVEKGSDGRFHRRVGVQLDGSPLTFAEMGVDPNDAELGRKFFKLAEDLFRQCIEQDKAKGKEPTITAVYREAKRVLRGDEITIDVPDRMTATVANAYFAQVCNAIEQHDSNWLLGEDCRFLFEKLHLPYSGILAWARNGCEPRMVPMSEVQISFLKSKYDPNRFAFEAMGGDCV
jgi:hypothetical protein